MIRTSRLSLVTAVAAAGAIAFTPSSIAQPGNPGEAQQQEGRSGSSTMLEEVVVTARRRSEALQDVPLTVNAVSGDRIRELVITDVADIQQVVPGVSIEGSSSGSGGFGSSSSIRGVPTFLNSAASPVVQFYLNEAPVGRGPGIISSLYDIGQVEVLKGPQGTLRGRSAPMGTITATTQRPDLEEFGASVGVVYSDVESSNLQGALNIPLMQGVLGLRLAGVRDESEGSRVESANSDYRPRSITESWRSTLGFEPTDNFSASLMYQRMDQNSRSFGQVEGPGNGLNGPSISADGRLGVTDKPNRNDSTSEFVILQAYWEIGPGELSYIGSYRDSHGITLGAQDSANIVADGEWFQNADVPSEEFSHELRWAASAGRFDYTIGAFFDREESQPYVTSTAVLLGGAFGDPALPPVAGDPDLQYSVPLAIDIDQKAEEVSFFASLTTRLGEDSELTVGGRHIDFERNEAFSIATLDGGIAFPEPFPGFCTTFPDASPSMTYPGSCDLFLPGAVIQAASQDAPEDDFVYNISLSHDFNDNLMAYATVGTAFRTAGQSIGIQSPAECCTSVDLGSIRDLIFHPPEDSISYEIGLKTNFWDGRGLFNISFFHQEFNDYIYLSQSARYLSLSSPEAVADPTLGQVSAFEFTGSADAQTQGVDIELALQLAEGWSTNMGLSYADSELTGGSVPCNDGNFDGKPDAIVPTVQDFITAGTMVARCAASGPIARTPDWNFTLQSDYRHPLTKNLDAVIRGNYVYYPDNDQAIEGRKVDSYDLLNLYAGIAADDGAWEITLFVKNATDSFEVVSGSTIEVNTGARANEFFPAPASGYQSVGVLPEREFGVNLRYAMGSR